MATLYIGEYEDLAQTTLNVVREPYLVQQTLTVGNSVVSSAVFNKRTRVIRLHSDSTCCVEIGNQTMTATAGTSQRLAAGQSELREIPQNSGFQISVVGAP
jgi:hypothetical protein